MPVSEPATNPITIARNKLMNILKDEFSAEGFPVTADILHKSLGNDGRTRIGVSPLRETPVPSNKATVAYDILVQFYGKWDAQVDPTTKVDPTRIETFSERFKRALYKNDPGQDSVWFFSVAEIAYPHDPTGNATRFEAKIIAFGTNTAILETVG